jgi:dolichol kinase
MTPNPPTGRLQPLRKLIHLAGAAFPLLYLFASRAVVLAVALVALAAMLLVEWGRQRWPALERLFKDLVGPALREDEQRRPTAGLPSMLAILFTLIAVPRPFAIPAMLYAQVGDPAAEIVGRRWGRHRLPSGKSWEGSLGCFAASLAVGLLCTLLLPLSPGVAALGAALATLAEALAPGDNLVMAPLSGLAMTLAARLLAS